jgi:hypothetical protein
MARRPRPTTKRTAVRNDSQPTSGRDAVRTHFTEWHDQAAALEQAHSLKPSNIPTRIWRHAYVQGLSPDKAADHAARSAYNVRPAGERLKGRR